MSSQGYSEPLTYHDAAPDTDCYQGLVGYFTVAGSTLTASDAFQWSALWGIRDTDSRKIQQTPQAYYTPSELQDAHSLYCLLYHY